MDRRVNLFAVAVAVAATAAFAIPAVPVAFAGDDDRHEHRRDDDDRGRDRDRDYGRDRDRHDRDDRHDSRWRGPRYAVTFHLDGGVGRHKARDRFRAAEIQDELDDLGVSVHVHDRRELHFKMRGERRTFVRSHEDAHKLARRLNEWGFHASVSHR